MTAPGRTPFAREAELVAGRVEVVLQTGRSVSGVVREAGRPPPAPFVLTLEAPGSPTVPTDPAGRFRFWGVPSDWRGALLIPDGYTLAGGGRRLELAGPADGLMIAVRRPDVLAGRVRTRDGTPVAGALVSLSEGGRTSRSVGTGADGSFRFEGVTGPRVSLRTLKSGFVPAIESERPLPGPGEEVSVLLDPGRDVRVLVRDESGRSVVAAVEVEVPGFPRFLENEPTWPVEVAADLPAFFADLPPGPVVFRTRVGGRDYEIGHDSREPEARIVVPVHGSVRVRWRFRLERRLHRIRLESTGPAGAEVCEEVPPDPDREEWEAVVLHVLPGTYRVHLDALDGETGRYREWRHGPTVEVAAARDAEATIE